MEGGFMAGTLTKADIIAAIQTENGYSLQEYADTVETLIEIIKSTPETGEDVLISGLANSASRIRENAEVGIQLRMRI
jgi:nucleoid DNA-binding protein